MAITIPTWLTIARIAVLAPLAVLLVIDDPAARWLALGLFTAAALTDWVDGRLARAWDQVTPLGRCLDPIADKLLVATPLVVLLGAGSVPMWPVLVILVRELTVSGLREALAGKGPALPVTLLAKWKTTAQMVALAILIVAPELPYGALVGSALLWVAAVLTAITGAQYVKAGLVLLMQPTRAEG